MFKISKIKVMLSSLALLLFLPMAAQAQVYGVSLNGANSGNPGASSLYTIDPATGAGTLVGDFIDIYGFGGYAVNAIAIDPTTGNMYASTTNWSGVFNGLLAINSSTGVATEIGEFGDTADGRALTFDSAGQLWGWSEESDDPITIDKATGAATVVGESGIGTARQVLAFDSSDALILVQNTNVYTIDQVTGAAVLDTTLSFDPGRGGAVFDATDMLWAPETSGATQDSVIRITDIADDSFTDVDTDIEYLIAVTAMGTAAEPVPVTGTLRFNVTKTFTDGSEGDVEVMLSCNSGLPLEQSATISGGDPAGVTFVLTEVLTAVDCEVTETGSPDGYVAVLNGGFGCAWSPVTEELSTCSVQNRPVPGTFIVNKVWEVTEEVGGDEILRVAEVTIICDAEILGGYQEFDDDDSESEKPRDVPMPYEYDEWMLDGTIIGDGSLVAIVDTSMGPVMCGAEETSYQSGVESTDDCGLREIDAGETSECTIINTVFFEGIPSLNQYGLAIMALLMLGLGMVGFRRFV